jgi:hypothetical protein
MRERILRFDLFEVALKSKKAGSYLFSGTAKLIHSAVLKQILVCPHSTADDEVPRISLLDCTYQSYTTKSDRKLLRERYIEIATRPSWDTFQKCDPKKV